MRKIIFLNPFLFFLLFTSCGDNSDVEYYQRALNFEKKNNYGEAKENFLKAFKISNDQSLKLEAAKKLSFIYEVIEKKYLEAKYYLKYCTVNIDDFAKGKELEERLAEINFNYLQDYEAALVNLYRLIETENRSIKINEYRFKIAQAYFRNNSFAQALIELDKISPEYIKQNEFDVLNLKASVLQGQNKNKEVADILNAIMEKFPVKSRENETFLTLSISYEQSNQFDKAIETLEKNKLGYKSPEFLEYRIASLKKRQKFAPLVKELKK